MRCTHAHTHIQTHTYTHTHIHINTHIRIYMYINYQVMRIVNEPTAAALAYGLHKQLNDDIAGM